MLFIAAVVKSMFLKIRVLLCPFLHLCLLKEQRFLVLCQWVAKTMVIKSMRTFFMGFGIDSHAYKHRKLSLAF